MADHRVLIAFHEPHFAGVGRHVLNLLDAMKGRSHQWWILCSTDDDKIIRAFEDRIGKDRVTIVPAARLFSFSGFLAAVRLMREHHIHTLHIHNLQSAAWGYAASILGPCRRTVFTPHVSHIGIRELEPLFRLCWKALLPFTDAYVAVSEEQRKHLVAWGIGTEDTVFTVQNRMDEQETMAKLAGADREAMRTSVGLPHDAVVVCQIGRLDRQKNPLFLVRVAEIVLRMVPNVFFIFVGEGRLSVRLRNTIDSLGLSERVRLLGFRSDALRVLFASDILALSSSWEAFGYVMLEAALLKKPVVATFTEGGMELVKEGITGFLADSEEEFAARVIDLARSESMRERMGAAGYEHNRDLFSLAGVPNLMERVYGTSL
ncbi:MAG: glycosyltransferase family 4 protein [Pseudomonadota bacterium]